MRRPAVLTSATALLVCVPTALAQLTLHVDAAAADPGDGSAAAPSSTITDALADPRVNAIQATIVQVEPGTCVESQIAEGRVLVESTAGPDETFLEPASPTDVALSIPDFSGLSTLTGFTIDGTGQSIGFRVGDLSRGWIENCVVRGHAIGAEDVQDVRIDRCTFVDNAVSTVETLGPTMLSPATYIEHSIFYTQGPDPPTYSQVVSSLIGVDPASPPYPDDVHPSRVSPAVPLGTGVFAFDEAYPAQSTGYAGSQNSTGESAHASATFSASLAAGDLRIHGDAMPPGEFALLLHGTEAAATPPGSSALCIGGDIVRVDLQATSSSGEVMFPFDGATWPVVAPLHPGDSLQF